MTSSNPFSRVDKIWTACISLLVHLLGALGVMRYGLTWDEPFYFRFARLQREWIQDILTGLFYPSRLGRLLSPDVIGEVWLQHAEKNGHPPFTETWQGLVAWPFDIMGMDDIQAFRIAMTVMMGLTSGLLFMLLRRSFSRPAALSGVLVFLGIPCIWAHGHLGATEMPQCFFWVLFALLTPPALKKGGRWLFIWLAVSAFSFTTKFTNVLIPAWVLGTAGILGAYRLKRFWLLILFGFILGPLLLMILDPFFWPWLGGWDHFVDYLSQTITRADWVPLSVFYLGTDWGFYPPWHYRIVQIIARLPVTTLLLFIPGLFIGIRSLIRQIRRQEITGWVEALGVTGLLGTLLVGILPNSPNHDGARQFVYVFVCVSFLTAASVEWMVVWLSKIRLKMGASWRKSVRWIVLIPACVSFVIALAGEPWGLSYYSEWLGGIRGAWNKGFEISYWGETITPHMLTSLERIPPRNGTTRRVLTLPKLNYFYDNRGFLEPLIGVPPGLPEAKSIVPAFMQPWLNPELKSRYMTILTFTVREPPDAIMIFYRRAMDTNLLWETLENLDRRDVVELIDETLIDGIPMARLYRVLEVETATVPGDPVNWTWYRPATIADEG